MKLAEALSIRGDLQKRIDQMGSRLNAACRVQEGDEPAEMAEDILRELQECLAQVEDLVIKINKTNQCTVLPDGMTITAKIAHRDMLKKHCGIIQSLLNNLTQRSDRFSRNEIKFVTTVDVRELRKKGDALSKALRETDMEIQAANWSVDICD